MDRFLPCLCGQHQQGVVLRHRDAGLRRGAVPRGQSSGQVLEVDMCMVSSHPSVGAHQELWCVPSTEAEKVKGRARGKRTLGDGLKGALARRGGFGVDPRAGGVGNPAVGQTKWSRPQPAHPFISAAPSSLVPLSTLSVGPSGWAWGGEGRGLCRQFALGKSLKVDQLVAGQLAHKVLQQEPGTLTLPDGARLGGKRQEETPEHPPSHPPPLPHLPAPAASPPLT